MTRDTRDKLGQPRTTDEEARQIAVSARQRRIQMLPGEGPQPPEKDAPVDHFKGPKSEVALGPRPDDPLPGHDAE